MSKFLLALDQSTQTTGYAVFKDRELITVGHISPSGNDYMKRIVKTRNWLERIIFTLDGEIEVVLEDIQLQELEPNGTKKFAKNMGVDVFKKLAHVQGALISLLEEKKIKYSVVIASSWKKSCKITGIHRDEQKKSAQAFVLKNYNKKVTQDEADAICIGYHHLKNTGFDWS